MKNQFFFGPSDRQVDDKEAFLTLGVAALMMIGFAASAVLDYTSGRNEFAAAPSISTSAVSQSEAVAPPVIAKRGEQVLNTITQSVCGTDTATGTPRAAALTVGDSARMRGAGSVGPTRPGTHSAPALVIDF